MIESATAAVTSVSAEKALSEADEHMIDNIYDQMVSNMCIDIACEVHKEIKTGESSRWRDAPLHQQRRKLYPSVHISEETMNQSLDYYATNVPVDDETATRQATERANLSTIASEQPPAPPESTIVTRHQQNHTDIWGNTPPKEPKILTRCNVCGRDVGVLRFAPHLDKCMGIGTTVRAAAASAHVGQSGI